MGRGLLGSPPLPCSQCLRPPDPLGPSVLPRLPPASAACAAVGVPDPAPSPCSLCLWLRRVSGSRGNARGWGQLPGGRGGPQMGQVAQRLCCSSSNGLVTLGLLGLFPPRCPPHGSPSLPLLSVHHRPQDRSGCILCPTPHSGSLPGPPPLAVATPPAPCPPPPASLTEALWLCVSHGPHHWRRRLP